MFRSSAPFSNKSSSFDNMQESIEAENQVAFIALQYEEKQTASVFPVFASG